METKNIPIKDLKPAEYNPRQATKKQVEDLERSIKKFGIVDPIIVNSDMTIIGGHFRVRTAKTLGIKEVPCVVLDLDKEKEKELNLRLNRNLGEWDWELLANLDTELLIDVGFDEEELSKQFDLLIEPDAKDDEVPDVPDEPQSKLGDIYILGNHRLMCGDATKIEDVEKLMDGKKADMVFTDPPYGMNAVSKSGVLKKNYGTDILGDENIEVAVDSFVLLMSMKIPTVVFWGANYYANKLPNSSCWIVWDKNNGASDQMDCELAWTNLGGVTRQYTQASEKTNRLHPTQKPVELMIWCIQRLNVNPKIVLDVFLGSGSTLIACEKTNRMCYGMELDPKYCDTTIVRWEQYTGKKAELIKQ